MKLPRLALAILLALLWRAPTVRADDEGFSPPAAERDLAAQSETGDQPADSSGAPAPLAKDDPADLDAPSERMPSDETPPRPEDLPQETVEPEPIEASAGQPGSSSTYNDGGSGVPAVIPPGSGLPASPYKAGLPYLMTPQPFRVPFFNRLYPPGPHYVQRCPYYPGGVYPGARWFSLIGWQYRFNPYRADQLAAAHGTRRRAPLPTLTPRPGSPPPVNMHNIQRPENPTGAAVARTGAPQGEEAQTVAESRDSARHVAGTDESSRKPVPVLPAATPSRQVSQRQSIVRRSE